MVKPNKTWARIGDLSIFGLGVIGVLLCIYVVYYLSFEIRREIDALATANSDNIQWSLAQNEVELTMTAIAREAQDNPALLGKFRQSFDIFYSRVVTLEESNQFDILRKIPEAVANIATIRAELDRNIALIDGDDRTLQQALPEFIVTSERLQRNLRLVSLHGIGAFSALADQRREDAAWTLKRVGILTGVLVLELSALVFVLTKLVRQSQIRAKEQTAILARLETVVSTSLDAVIVMDRAGRILDYNGAAEGIFGYPRDEALGQSLAELIIPEHLRKGHTTAMLRYRPKATSRVVGGGRLHMEGQRKDGSIFPVEFSVATARGPEGDIFVSYLRDISTRLQAEQDLVQARDRALLGEKAKADFLAVMSHEMRTPLNGMLGTLELLQQTRLNADQRRFVQIIQNSGDLLLHHVSDVLDLSRLDAGMMEITRQPFSLAKLLDGIIENQKQLALTRGNQIQFQMLDPNLDWVEGDDNKLRQILMNLVGNAVKFTRNGEVSVHVMRGNDGQVEFRVTDSGVGISDEDQTRIFEDFVTIDASYMRTAGGTGLGLGIVRRLVRNLGGDLGVQSQLEKGSTFWVRLDLPEVKQPKAVPPKVGRAPKAAPITWAGKNVLIVEDNQINRLVVSEMLKRQGLQVQEAHDGMEGVAMAAQVAFDLILMDISMPGMDGLTATKHIKADPKSASNNSPIVALTAHALPDEVERFAAAGMAQTLTKPISIQRLDAVLAAAFGKKSGQRTRRTKLAEPDILDKEGLAQLQDTLGPQAFKGLLDKFLAQTDTELGQLAQKLARNDKPDETAALAHRLAGSAAVFGAVGLNRALLRIENAFKTDKLADLPKLAAALPGLWAETQTHLSNEVEGGIKAATLS